MTKVAVLLGLIIGCADTLYAQNSSSNAKMGFVDNYYNSFGASLETGEGSYLYLEGRDISWQLSEKVIAGPYVGVVMMPDNWVPSLALELNYINDYGAQFVPYVGAASGMSLAIISMEDPISGETETDVSAGFLGFGKVGAYWFFSKRKTSALYTDLAFGHNGGVDFRVGFAFAISR